MLKLVFPRDSFESKVYSVTCIIACVFSILASIFNVFVGIELWFNVFIFGVGLLFLYFHLSRLRRGVVMIDFIAYIFCSVLLLTVSWFVNSGLEGSMSIIFILFLIQFLIITRVKYMKYVLIALILLLSSIITVEFLFPESVVPYDDLESRKFDIVITMFLVIFGTSYFIYEIKKAYEGEKRKLKLGLELTQKAKLEYQKYSKLQSEFIANVSHEIRTPLNGIIGNAELLSELNKSKESSDYVENISKSGQLLLGIINNILDLSKMESDKLDLINRSFSLNELLNQVKSVFRLQAKQKGINLEFHVDSGVPDTLKGDNARLKQIFLNILGNAVKFTESGAVTVRINGEQKRDKYDLTVSVKDTGIGIAKGDLKNLFNRFFQVNQSLSKRHEGFGLGLIITKNLLRVMGGDISVESVEGEGAEFTFNVLLETDVRSAEKLESKNSSFSKDIKVLVAEDNEINAMLMERQLETFGLKPKIVVNGLEVLEAMNIESYDLIFMDVQMPELDGIQATIRIRANQSYEQPVIIAITAGANADHKEKCLLVGMNDYLTKPTSSSDIHAMIVKWFKVK